MMLARTFSKSSEIFHCPLFMVLNAGLEKTQVSKALINSVLVEQLMWHRADANHTLSRCSSVFGCAPQIN